MLRDGDPDVVVLDLTSATGRGIETILDIRHNSGVPIVVVCDPAHPAASDYRLAGAVDCIAAPIDLIALNRLIQEIVRVTRTARTAPVSRGGGGWRFAGISFQPFRNVLVGAAGATVDLTTTEARLLSHFLTKPWSLCSRVEIGALLYGHGNAVGERAIDIVVNRLRKKLIAAGGSDAEHLIKTEFRQGYGLIADVSAEAIRMPASANGRASAG
ncbi:MAG: winged helix-turn-helix domain-containing protein [Xanthobacteraceae bacterium]